MTAAEKTSYSVVMTAYNEEEWVAAAVASVLAQTHRELRLILVDDGSSDGTVAAVERFRSDPRLHVIQQPNAGLSAARNTGIAAAGTEWIAFLDSDDLWMPDYLEKVDRALADRPRAGFAYVDAWRLDVDGRFFRESAMVRQNPPADPPSDAGDFLRLLVDRGNFIFVSTTVRKAAIERVGGFDEARTSVEDYDLWIRILGAGYEAVHADGRPAIKRDRPTAMSAQTRKMLTNLRDVYRHVERDYEVPDDVRPIGRAHADKIDRMIEQIDSGGAGRAAMLRVRLALGSAWRRMQGDRIWHRETPPEVAAAFPDLKKPG
jgi:glycosyltransferase involved in cell wall biosynthesis